MHIFFCCPDESGGGPVPLKTITAKQKKIIWAIARDLGIDKDTLYAGIFGMWEVERMSALTARQADLLIQDLRKKQIGLGAERLTPDQYRAILSYQRYLGWTTQHLRHYVTRQTGVSEVKWLTVWQARAVLTGMENVKQKGRGNGVQQGD